MSLAVKRTPFSKFASSRNGRVTLRSFAYPSRRERNPEQGYLGLLPCSLFELTAEILPILFLRILLDTPFLELVFILALSTGELA